MINKNSVEAPPYMVEKRKIIDRYIDLYIPSPDEYPQALHEAIRYAVLAGGKRLRPILALASYEACGGANEVIYPAAVALDADTYAYMLVALTHGYVENGRYAECVDICVAAEQLLRELLPEQAPPRIITERREFCQARTENARLLP